MEILTDNKKIRQVRKFRINERKNKRTEKFHKQLGAIVRPNDSLRSFQLGKNNISSHVFFIAIPYS